MLPVRNLRGALAVFFCLSLTLDSASAAPSTVKLLTQDHAELLYRQLLERHWIPETGLFLSFPDSSDRKIAQQASTYDQAAMGLLAIQVGDTERAKTLFQFFKMAWVNGPQKQGPNFGQRGLSNFYNGEFGTDGIEKTIHLGPNAWVGLFAARLANQTQDQEALQLALDLAYWITNSLPHENGAVAMGTRDEPRGGPWSRVYSTENNLSYYGFLTELLRSTRIEKAQRVTLTQERDRVENWLINSMSEPTTARVNRGVHPGGLDKIQALDTITWMVSAIGPKRLSARGIDPYQMMKNAEKAFEVTVGGMKGVDPADQAEANVVYSSDRPTDGGSVRPKGDGHRMIWYEGLGQYILAWAAVTEFEQKEGRTTNVIYGLEKTRRLQEQFDQAALPHYPGRSAYPYATPGKFFRDGWRSPAPSAKGPAASLIAGVWRAFAGIGFDPLSGKAVSTIQPVTVAIPKKIRVAVRPPAVLYGTSEDMVVRAWRYLKDNEVEGAMEQARATIQEWAPFAQQLQKRKMAEVGQLLSYSGSAEEKRKIFSYWALNDVGAAYFILGKAHHDRGEYSEAAQAFQQVMTHYNLAQIWDPQGWFWAPAEAVVNEYSAGHPEHYSSLVPQELAADHFTTGKRPY